MNNMMSIDYIYNDSFTSIQVNTFNSLIQRNKNLRSESKKSILPEITSDFYVGFGLDLLE